MVKNSFYSSPKTTSNPVCRAIRGTINITLQQILAVSVRVRQVPTFDFTVYCSYWYMLVYCTALLLYCLLFSCHAVFEESQILELSIIRIYFAVDLWYVLTCNERVKRIAIPYRARVSWTTAAPIYP